MSPTLENEIKRGVLAPELESKDIPVDNIQQFETREGLPLPRKKARPLEEDVEDDPLGEDGDCSQMLELISSKRRRLEDGTAQLIRHRQERKRILAKHGVSYRLNRHGTGIFTLNKQRCTSSGISRAVRAKHVS